MKRRAFMNWVGVSFMATSLPIAIAACSPTEDTAEDTTAADPCAAEPCAATSADASPDASSGEGDFVSVGTVADLDSAGYLTSEDFPGGAVIAIRDPANADSVLALSSVCTHNGCNVDWQSSEFVCPCHGSKFSADGEVTNGPASEALSSYEAMIEGDQVLVKAA